MIFKETVTAIMMLYKEAVVCSLYGDPDFFDIVAEVLQGDTLALFLFIISQDYVQQTSIDLKEEKNMGSH